VSRFPTRLAISALLAVLGLASGLRAQTLIGPTPYLSFNDSPFKALSTSGGFTYFYLEDFEDGLLNTPGVSATGGAPYGPGGLTDSVDGDDGAIDGSGTNGHSFAYLASSVTFTFNAATLGGYPTHAGLVWTDGPDPIFEAFDASGASLGTRTGTFADGSFTGTTGEDRFFGVTYAGGISKISITASSWEVDHLQYGLAAISEPGTCAGLAGTAALMVAALRRKRSRSERA